ncbi:MAG TPA: Rieske (2Fe-2S) protein [Actinomycetota bacterium]|nr:Rieske (2Fe-2S) protein [Actinomycetota bacterium]
MQPHRLLERIEASEGLERAAAPVAQAAGRALPPGPLKDALSGTWLGHALHPVLTDVPIGTWVSAAILDLFGGAGTRDAARKLVGAGLLAAVPTAVTGLADWSDTQGRDNRTGVAHASANTLALAAYGASYAARRAGRHRLGVALGFAGGAIASAGAYLGGHLSLARGVGVDQATFEAPPGEWTRVADEADLADGRPHHVHVSGTGVVLVRSGDRVHALVSRCSHLGGPLDEGDVDGGTVTCPWHGSVFRLDDGAVVRGPARAPQPVLDARVRDGGVEVRAPG